MAHFDWIVLGAGITGLPLAYELQKVGQRVLLLDKVLAPVNATAYGYGGVPYWSGTTPLLQQLCRESRALLGTLAQELDGATEYRELDLLLYLQAGDDPQGLEQNFRACLTPPTLLDQATVLALEPQLNPAIITGALTVPHGHIHPIKTLQAYRQAFLRLGGEIKLATVQRFLHQGDTLTGVVTSRATYAAPNIVVCAGADSRALLSRIGVDLPLYFSQALVLQTPPLAQRLAPLVMPARFARLALEAQASSLDWSTPTDTVQAEVLEAGAIQFLDGHYLLGQISQLVTHPAYQPDPIASEQRLRAAIAQVLPNLANVPAQLHHCRVAFASPNPLVGQVKTRPGLYLFTGFSSPFCYSLPLARHFAQAVTTGHDAIFTTLNQQLQALDAKQ